ncbi:hypothetical protein C2S53_018487 [Perilla frutescens var. hirtella]|uniref:Membrane-associated kinase regulator 4 n=1 Tax=Perilla frutescens var. hirtella TaxID=608512 RepID=A0AAD4P4H2_PERFH|nr:hypothetical protein C2S53_018487 [Perilla frutescens var. hirtella]
MEARNLSFSLCDDGDEEEEYIDMELSSPQSSREFEFQMSTTSNHTQTTTSPADELFYKGKLLPLYLPPRRQMVQSLLLLQPADPAANSPSESCRVSCELNPDDYLFEWSNELNSFININMNNNHPTKISSWSQKLRLIKHSILGHNNKLKASTAYLKSLFVKSACSSHDSSAKPTLMLKNNMNMNINATRKPLHPTIATIMNSIEKEENSMSHVHVQRRSFSSAIKRHYSPTKCLSSSSSNSNSSSGSSSFSLNSNGLHELHCLRRSSSATEIEGSIEAAIAHCKSSHSSI